MQSSIPFADISALVSDASPSTRLTAAKQLADAVRIHGCAAVTGHGLSETDLKDAFAAMRKLFDLPIEQKLLAPHPEGPFPHRGYLAKAIEQSGKLGIVHSKDEKEKEFFKGSIDWKETYDIGDESNNHQPNIWLPDDVYPGFKPYMLDLYSRINSISASILEGLLLGMDLTETDCEALREMHAKKESQMRLAHYLPMTTEDQSDPNKIRLAAHRDFSSFTLLFQESASGLEFQNRETGEYMPATPKEGTLYLNVGDLMERYSNGFYPSAMHRVAIDPTRTADGTVPGRFSLPFFTKVRFTDEIYPMPSRCAIDGKANYESIGYRALASKMFESLMAKPS